MTNKQTKSSPTNIIKNSGFTLNDSTIIVDLSTVSPLREKQIERLEKLRLLYLANTVNTLMDLNTELQITVVFKNKPVEKLTIETAPESMTIKQIKEYNETIESVSPEAIEALIKSTMTNSYAYVDDELIKTLIKKEHPTLSDLDIQNVFSMAYDLWRRNPDWIQNVDSLVDLVVATKEQKSVFA